ncbi:class E sortase [Knoellia subterranea]|uniref:class E sortase n=1 Tax=Knoellia subterranea TaxID=184882 RepID=UPI001FDFA3B8|nr:class E sortase [Knoellia subterranea]
MSRARRRGDGAVRGGVRAGALGVLGEVLMTLGALVVLFVVWQVWWTDVSSDRAHAATVSTLEREFASGTGDPGSTSPTDGLPAGAFAIVRVPRFGADYARPLVEGTSAAELAEGLGHYDGTAGPGEVGNFAIAGHRTTYGKPLAQIDSLREGDRIVVETAAGWTVYAVSSHEIVRPSQWRSSHPSPETPEQRRPRPCSPSRPVTRASVRSGGG